MRKNNEKFKEVRSALGLTQNQYAALLDLSEPTIRSYEKSFPKIGEGQKSILMRIGVDPDYITCVNSNVSMLLPNIRIEEARANAQALLEEV